MSSLPRRLTPSLGMTFKSSLCPQSDSLPTLHVPFLGLERGRKGEALRVPGPQERQHSGVWHWFVAC